MKTVRDHVSRPWLKVLHNEVLECPAESVVGSMVLKYLAAVEAVLALTEEDDEHRTIEGAVVRQINVWYFG